MTYGRKASLFQQTPDRQVNDLQRAIANPLRQLQTLLPTTGVYVTTVPNSVGIPIPIAFAQDVPVTIYHNLGYAYTGWILSAVRYDSGTLVAPLITDFPTNETELTRQSRIVLVNVAPVTVTAHLWVF